MKMSNSCHLIIAGILVVTGLVPGNDSQETTLSPEIDKYIPKGLNFSKMDMDCYYSFFDQYIKYEKEEKELWRCRFGCQKWQICCLNYTVVERIRPLIGKEKIGIRDCVDRSKDVTFTWEQDMNRKIIVEKAVDALLSHMRNSCEPEIEFGSNTCARKKRELNNGTVTQDQLCASDPGQRLNRLGVNAAFKIGSYIVMVGRIWRDSEPMSTARNVTIRVMYNTKRDPTVSTKFFYYDAKVWDEFQAIDERRKINYIFVTEHMPNLFPTQKLNQVVYVVQVRTGLVLVRHFHFWFNNRAQTQRLLISLITKG